ncbi:MAG: class I SAM-dependent rRNA methyltransferase [Leptospiraceae bacterium]|nr:class I SAM-dependent rRNA methyltransferase [Leptospiraceae bacterium]
MKHLTPINLTNATAMLVLTGHPWIFRNKFSRYEKDLQDGDWLLLLGAGNKELGVGVYSNTGLIAVRIFYFGENFSLEILRNKISKRIEKRFPLLEYTNSIRWIHGENDNLPGVTVDGHGKCLTVMCYSTSLESFARYISKFVYSKLLIYEKVKVKPEVLILTSPNRKGFESKKTGYRLLRGTKPEQIEINYRGIDYLIDPFGQKSGMYNDIRNLRDYVLNKKGFFSNKTILNLFSSNGLLSICLEQAGSELVVSLEDSRKAIAVHESNLPRNRNTRFVSSIASESYTSTTMPDSSSVNEIRSGKQIILKADIFKQLKSILENLNIQFDVIIIDPPSLTANDKDKVNARLTYKRLVSESIPYLKEKGSLILCSCSNRIHPNDFEKICKEAITESGRKIKTPVRLTNEIDHPTLATFPEGNYFKAHIYHDLSSI